jgi:hypothetical protein
MASEEEREKQQQKIDLQLQEALTVWPLYRELRYISP